MKRWKLWKLWTAIATGLVIVGGGSGFYFWTRPSSSDLAQAAERDPESTSPFATPPQPIPDSAAEFNPNQTQFVTPASFNSPTADNSATGDSNSEAPPPRPRFTPATNNDSAVSASGFSARRQNFAEGSRYRTSLTDDASPPATLPVAETEVPATEAPGTEAPSPVTTEPPSEPDNSSEQSPASADAQDVAKTDSPAPGNPPAILETPAESPTKSAPSVIAPPKPLSLRPSAPDSNSKDSAVQAPPLPEANPGTSSRYSNAPRPKVPSLRTNTSRDSAPRTSEPATLPESEATASETLPQRGPEPRPAVAASRASRLVSNEPGERKLEGMQAPSLTVVRSAPEEIQVGKPAKFVLRVRNVGQVAAQDVVVTDRIPQGTRFVMATPETTPSANGDVAWELGTLLAGEEAVLTIELLPEAEGEIGSVAEVTCRIQAAVRTISTKPLLKVEHSGPAKVLIGDEVPFQISITNPGTGIASRVVIEVDVPDGLVHDGGREIMSDPFDLKPNESRKIDLVLKAVQAGPVQSVVRAVGDFNLQAEHRTQLEVLAPQLQISVAGPTRRFLDRPVKYQIGIDNPGTAPAQEIELVARLPRGLKFVAADKKGQYDQRQHAVMWSLEELPAGEQGVVELTAIPTDVGEQKLHVEARGALALEHQHEHTTVVEDITDLAFTVTDENVPIEVGSDNTYQIRIANNGTKVARNVRLAVTVPDGLEIVDFDGPTQFQKQSNQLVTQPIAELGLREEAVYRITAKGTRAGDQILRVQLLSDEFSTPVTKEEITKVYADK